MCLLGDVLRLGVGTSRAPSHALEHLLGEGPVSLGYGHAALLHASAGIRGERRVGRLTGDDQGDADTEGAELEGPDLVLRAKRRDEIGLV